MDGSADLVFRMVEEAGELDPDALDRLRTWRQWVLFHESVVRRSGLSATILRDPDAAEQAVHHFIRRHSKRPDMEWHLAVAGFLGEIEQPTWGGSSPVPAHHTLETWAEHVLG